MKHTTKRCSKCKKMKPLEEFAARGGERPKHLPSGRASACKRCTAAYAKERRRLHGPRRQTKQENDQRWANNLRSLYKIDKDAYNSMFARQGGVCAICKQPESRRGKYGEPSRLSVDHCHESGRVRGLLCLSCNTKIGPFKDADWLAKALRYLMES